MYLKLAGSNRPIALAQANAILSRIDLVSEVIVCFISFNNYAENSFVGPFVHCHFWLLYILSLVNLVVL